MVSSTKDAEPTTDESSSSVMKEDTHKTPLETPRVLTRNLIPGLTYGLDASDVLECYALVRSAPLHGIANSTITIHKMVLGIRFRPKGGQGDIAALHVKEPMELTLEYGPQRVGTQLNDEAVPIIQVEESTSYLSWDNVGKVYFTRKIVKENYLSSYYMASMTGAVLDELLAEAVDYAERKRIYQPFAVYSEERGRELRSSSSSDFVWFVWSRLAELGVEIDPILPPPTYEARIWVKSITKVVPEPFVVHKAATFYQKIYACLEQIASNNYGNFDAPRQSETPQPSDAPTGEPMEDSADANDDNDDHNEPRRMLEMEDDHASLYDDSDGVNIDPSHRLANVSEVGHTDNTATINSSDSPLGQPPTTTMPPSLQPIVAPSSLIQPSSNHPTGSPSTTPLLPTQPPTNPPSISVAPSSTDEPTSQSEAEIPTENVTPAEPGKDVEKAKQAADEAQKAADEAKSAAQTEGETKAADAAQAAADAAHTAAAVTSKAAAQAAKDSLLSGDGAMMSSIVTTCFTNPQYEIASVDSNGTVTIEAYLYRDQSFYYRLELTSPYVAVAKVNRPIPQASVLSDYGPGGDSLDWFLALSLGALVLFMVLLICQQMGYHIIGSIVKCQRWFFNPRKYDYEGDTVSGVQSGPLFFFGEAGIPLSMGGRQSAYSPVHQRETLDEVIADNTVAEDEELQIHAFSPNYTDHRSHQELEMTTFSPMSDTGSPHMSQTLRRVNSSGSVASSDNPLENALPVPERLFRNPDLVDMPNLKSKSKVAVPVGTNSNANGSVGDKHSRSSSFGEAVTDFDTNHLLVKL